ncbi:MAG TPA: hypothetical protein VMJ66_06730 [Geobacteraceae bacterium]|nr:hypothetical protein [Geobacteraceae bacterium]
MKRTLIAAAVALFLAAPALADNTAPQPKGPGPNFEQRKAEILKRIDERIARNQEEKACVQAANSPADIKACREKFKSEIQEQRQQNQWNKKQMGPGSTSQP